MRSIAVSVGIGSLVLYVAAGATPLRAQASLVQTLTAEGRLNEAVRALDGIATPPQAEVLRSLAVAVLTRATAEDELLVAADACSTLRRVGDTDCEKRLRALATSSPTPQVVRLRILADDIATGRGGSDRLAGLTAGYEPRDWSALAESARAFPVSLRIPLLAQAIAQGTPDVQYSALSQLASIDDPAAVTALRPLAVRPAVPGRLLALAALARSGDPKALDEVRALLPELQGEERLAAGVALAAQGDPGGVGIIQDVQSGPDELLGLKASAALAQIGRPEGVDALQQALHDRSPWIRLRSLEYLQGQLTAPTADVWRLMADDMSWIRVRAAQVTLAALTGSRSATHQ